jgi:hypothetical protein
MLKMSAFALKQISSLLKRLIVSVRWPRKMQYFNECFAQVHAKCCDFYTFHLAVKMDRRMSLTYFSGLIVLLKNMGSTDLIAVMTHHTQVFWSWRGTSGTYWSEQWYTHSDGSKLLQ